MGENGQEKKKKKFSIPAMVKKIEDVFNEEVAK